MTATRRQFLKTATGTATAWIVGRAPRYPMLSAQSADSRIEVLVNEPIATIAPDIYGHFVEHLGGVVYDGIWVGERSKIANIGGLRRLLVDHLRKIKPAVIRWPGGCFADQDDWRDGIGPREKRPRRTNFWLNAREWPKEAAKEGPHLYDTNRLGTVELARFCKLTGAQPYYAANLRSLRPHDFWHWVEYCNSPAGSTTLAKQREADGEKNPLNVRFWGVGNESWGCGGNFAPEDYAVEFRRFLEWVPNYGSLLSLIGAGPGQGLGVDSPFFGKLAERNALQRMWGWALHHYSWNASGGRTTN